MQKFDFQLTRCDGSARGMKDKNNVNCLLDLMLWRLKYGFQLAFEPVSHHRPLGATTGTDAHPGNELVIVQPPQREAGTMQPPSAPIDGKKSPRTFQGSRRGWWRGSARTVGHAGMSSQRPFRRRRLRVRCPPRVLMRARNPWTRLPLMFDLVLRCFFMRGAPMVSDAEAEIKEKSLEPQSGD